MSRPKGFPIVDAVIDAAPEGRHDAMHDALLNVGTAEEVAYVLTREGYRISPSTIRTWRRAHRLMEEEASNE